MSWDKITCQERETLKNSHPTLGVGAALTDLDGEFGPPQIYTEWYDKTTEQPVLRDYRWPDRYGGPDVEPCEHYRWVATL